MAETPEDLPISPRLPGGTVPGGEPWTSARTVAKPLAKTKKKSRAGSRKPGRRKAHGKSVRAKKLGRSQSQALLTQRW